MKQPRVGDHWEWPGDAVREITSVVGEEVRYKYISVCQSRNNSLLVEPRLEFHGWLHMFVAARLVRSTLWQRFYEAIHTH